MIAHALLESTPAPRTVSRSSTGVQAFIFDVDGVLADTARLHRDAWQRLAKEEGLFLDEQLADCLRGLSREESLRKILGSREVSPERFQRLAELKNEYYRESLQSLSPDDALPGVRQFLGELEKHGLRSAAASASRNAGEVLRRLELASSFAIFLDGNDDAAVGDGRPLHRYLKAAARLKLPPERCVVVEDSSAGIAEARNFGMKTIGIGSSNRLAAADMVFESLRGVSVPAVQHWLR